MINAPLPRPKPRIHGNQHGVALVLVLCFLVLITFLVVAFFSSVTIELSGAKTTDNGSRVHQLVNSAVQTVLGSIRSATSSGQGNLAWASQPGMIRTFDNSGHPVSCYKLYSSDNLVVESGAFLPSSDLDARWSEKPALYTDINSPVISRTSTVFPILDGNGISQLTIDDAPALTWSADGMKPEIDGFKVDPHQVTYDSSIPPSSSNNPVPMPVKWIYVLRDGTFTVPPAGDKVARWENSSAAKPSADNPVVGRIAYWTDDDTCKVNLNTASEGINLSQNSVVWDMPRFNSSFESKLGNLQPAQNEFQRYPGHPATVSLSTVFSKLTGIVNYPESVYSMTPRVSPGGSKGGTALASGVLPLKTDRLYASVDEFLFASSSGRALNDQSKTAVTPATLTRAQFLATASSRAPDVNLFNQPRISIWPVSGNGSEMPDRSPLDQLIAFCSTINPSIY